MRITVVEDFERVCIDWMNSLGVVIDRKRDISWMGKEKRMEDFIFCYSFWIIGLLTGRYFSWLATLNIE